ncbi:MAG TPA: hypothetical protein VJ899_01985 [Salegentibacter sp.]|nr:hypothetical protein [Salegentibacter sp.]
MNNLKGGKRNKWYLILGVIFLVYGTYRLYTHLIAEKTDNFGLILAVGFIVFGIYDLFRYFRKV